MTRTPPSTRERHAVARALLLGAVLIGDEDDIWTHRYADEALGTLRSVIAAICDIVSERIAVRASIVSVRTIQLYGGEAPHLAAIVDYLLERIEGREYWQSMCPDASHPHRCPRCGAAAYVGFLTVECRAECAPTTILRPGR